MEDISKLLNIMRRLRDPQQGCPWDQQQDFASIAVHTLEEAYEVVDAIERDAMDELCDELGDLLLQVVYHAQIAEERGVFKFSDVVKAINNKLIRRHPHVFSEDSARTRATHDAALRAQWEAAKLAEREASAQHQSSASLLADVPSNLPGLTRAVKLSQRAARIGFDWPYVGQVRDKVSEELAELDEVLAAGQRGPELEEEIGDVLFAIANLCRHLGVDPEASVRRSNAKFVRRFQHVERRLKATGGESGATDLDTMERYWQEAKTQGL